MSDKLTIKQHIEVLNKCADSIDSEDGVVQQAIRDCADKLEKHIKALEENISSMQQTKQVFIERCKELEEENESLYRVLKCCDVDKFQEFCERKLKEKESKR